MDLFEEQGAAAEEAIAVAVQVAEEDEQKLQDVSGVQEHEEDPPILQVTVDQSIIEPTQPNADLGAEERSTNTVVDVVESQEFLSDGHSIHHETAPTASTAPDLEHIDEDSLTLAQRKELKERRFRLEKERRLREFLAVSKMASNSENQEVPAHDESLTPRELNDTTESGGDSTTTQANKRGSIAERFEMAKRQQQQQEEERLSKFKNDPRKRVSTDAFANTKSRWSSDPSKLYASQQQHLEEEELLRKSSMGLIRASSSSHQSAVPNDSIGVSTSHSEDPQQQEHESIAANLRKGRRGSSMRHMWEDVLNESKSTQENRFHSTKQQTISQFRETEGSGLVKKRIDEWDELHTQIAATAEQAEEFFKIAQEIALRKEEQSQLVHSQEDAIRAFQDNCLIPETFTINDTHIYPLHCFDPLARSFFLRYFKEQQHQRNGSGQMLSLSCGVYGEKTSTKPPIDVFSSVMRSATGAIYVSLTIKAVSGKELDSAVYGIKKVNVVVKELDNALLFDKLVRVLPVPGWESFIEGFENCWEEEHQRVKATSVSTHAVHEEKLLPFRYESGEHEENDTTIASSEELSSSAVVEGVGQDHDIAHIHSVNEESPSPEDTVVEECAEPSSEPVDVSVQDMEQETVPTSDAVHNADTESADVKVTLNPDEDELSDEGAGTWTSFVTPKKIDSNTQLSALDGTDRAAGPNNIDSMVEEETLKALALSEMQTPPVADKNFSMADIEDDTQEPNAMFQDDRSPSRTSSGARRSQNDIMHDDEEETYHFGRLESVAAVTMARSFLPHPYATNRQWKASTLSRAAHKLSWGLEDEDEEGLPEINHIEIVLDLSSVMTFQSAINALLAQSTDGSSFMFTGTLKYASTPTYYLMDNGKVFEWVRGAACSGWLVKFPMKSQALGRRTRRFFVLRDHYLSYHADKPRAEEEVSSFSPNTLLLTEDSTVTVTRKFLARCLMVTTPDDTLWIRVRGDNTEDAVKWLAELNKSIQFLQRPTYFSTLPRIESKWYHESPFFNIVHSDVVSTDTRYVKTALFKLLPNKTKVAKSQATVLVNLYSLDIASSEAPRQQLEVLYENESEILPAELSRVAVYGDVVLLGGEKGFLGFGVVTRARLMASSDPRFSPSSATALTSRKVILCIPFFDSQLLQSSAAAAATAASSASSGVGHDDVSEDDDIQEEPHAVTSTISCFAVASEHSVFVVGDNEGNLSLWRMPRNKELNSLSPNSAIKSQALKRVAKGFAPQCLSTLSLSRLDALRPSDNYNNTSSSSMRNNDHQTIRETILKMHFIENDRYLIVSTDKRLVMLEMRFGMISKRLSDGSERLLLYESFRNRSNSIDAFSIASIDAATSTEEVLTIEDFARWVQIDRARPGRRGLFDLCVAYVESLREESNRERKIVQWRVVESDEEGLDVNTVIPNASTSTDKIKKRCTVSRLQWSAEMFETTLQQLKPIHPVVEV